MSAEYAPPGKRGLFASTAQEGSAFVVVAVLDIGTIASGLLRIRAWLQKPAPPEVIEAAHRHDDDD